MNDPDLYAEMSKPRPREEAIAALHTFCDELAELRKKHRLSEVLYVAAAVVDEGPPAAIIGHRGSSANSIPLASIALRHFREERDRHEAALAGLGPVGPAEELAR